MVQPGYKSVNQGSELVHVVCEMVHLGVMVYQGSIKLSPSICVKMSIHSVRGSIQCVCVVKPWSKMPYLGVR